MSNENIFSAQYRVVSTASKQSVDSVTPSRTVYLHCHVHTILYKITCSRCSFSMLGREARG